MIHIDISKAVIQLLFSLNVCVSAIFFKLLDLIFLGPLFLKGCK